METSCRPGGDHCLPYDGKNSSLLEDWVCKVCRKTAATDGTDLLRCSRCKIVRYCSQACQRKDFAAHKGVCQVLNSLSLDLYCEALGLRSSIVITRERGEFKQNIFENCSGIFWEIPEARNYCLTRFRLSNILNEVAETYEVRPLLEIIANHRLELMRLIGCDELEQRYVVPFTLLSVNRDDDCYGFVKYWISLIIAGSYSPRMHQRSSRGHWIYLKDQDMTEDVLDVLKPNAPGIPLPFVAALCIIKLRIIAAHDARVKHFEIFSQSQGGRLLGDSLTHVRAAYVGDQAERKMIQRQEKHLKRYLQLMHRINPSFLPSIVNPRPLMGQEHSCTWTPGTPSEAYGVHYDSHHLFSSIPGALKRFEAVVGSNPTYDSDLSRGNTKCSCEHCFWSE